MDCLSGVDWAQLLSQESDIPCDVTFKIVRQEVDNVENIGITEEDELVDEPEAKKVRLSIPSTSRSSPPLVKHEDLLTYPKHGGDGEISLIAHKLLLAAASPVFCRQFYGSLPAGEEVVVRDSSVRAFKMMLGYVYDAGEKGVDDLDDIDHLLEVFYLAEKYQLLDFKRKILFRLNIMPLSYSDFEILVFALGNYQHFEDACEILEHRVVCLIRDHNNAIDLVNVAITSNNDKIKQEVLEQLEVEVVNETILETVKSAHDIINSDGCKLSKKLVEPVMENCVILFEEVKNVSFQFSQFIPDNDSCLQEAFALLLHFWKNNFCQNCDSAACKKGERVKVSEVVVGCNVLVNGDTKGVVSQVGIVKVKKLPIIGRLVECDKSPCDPTCQCQKVFSYCTYPAAWKASGKPHTSAKTCGGLHLSVAGVRAASMCKIILDSGAVVSSEDCSSIVFDCFEAVV